MRDVLLPGKIKFYAPKYLLKELDKYWDRLKVIFMQVEAPESFKKFVEDLKSYESVEDELLLKQIFNYGLDILRKEYSLELFAEDKLSIGEGAELANLSVGEFLELLVSRGLKSKVTVEDYQQGLRHAEEMLKE